MFTTSFIKLNNYDNPFITMSFQKIGIVEFAKNSFLFGWRPWKYLCYNDKHILNNCTYEASQKLLETIQSTDFNLTIPNEDSFLESWFNQNTNFRYLQYIYVLNLVLLFRLSFFWLTISFTTVNRTLSFLTHFYTSNILLFSFIKLIVLLSGDHCKKEEIYRHHSAAWHNASKNLNGTITLSLNTSTHKSIIDNLDFGSGVVKEDNNTAVGDAFSWIGGQEGSAIGHRCFFHQYIIIYIILYSFICLLLTIFSNEIGDHFIDRNGKLPQKFNSLNDALYYIKYQLDTTPVFIARVKCYSEYLHAKTETMEHVSLEEEIKLPYSSWWIESDVVFDQNYKDHFHHYHEFSKSLEKEKEGQTSVNETSRLTAGRTTTTSSQECRVSKDMCCHDYTESTRENKKDKNRDKIVKMWKRVNHLNVFKNNEQTGENIELQSVAKVLPHPAEAKHPKKKKPKKRVCQNYDRNRISGSSNLKLVQDQGCNISSHGKSSTDNRLLNDKFYHRLDPTMVPGRASRNSLISMECSHLMANSVCSRVSNSHLELPRCDTVATGRSSAMSDLSRGTTVEFGSQNLGGFHRSRSFKRTELEERF